jgi:hypothetical protein
MSFWCSVYLYVPVERLGAALCATASFAEPACEGTVEVTLPTGEVIPLPRLESGRASSNVLGCRDYLQLARYGTFWFPVDAVILEEEADLYASLGRPLPIEEREGVDCFPVTNIRVAVTCGCRFAELSFAGQNNGISRELFNSTSIQDRFAQLQEEIGAVAGVVRDIDQRDVLFTLDGFEEEFDWHPFVGDNWEVRSETVDALTEAVCAALGQSVPAVVVEPEWLAWNGETVRRLAEAFVADGDLDPLPVLADALEEAGCADPFLLGHARGRLSHARGSCRVIDLVLGRKDRGG